MKGIILIFLLFIQNTSSTSSIQPQSNHYCIVEIPKHSVAFNFLDITNPTRDSIIKLSEHKTLRVHFCKPLSKPCHGADGYSICLHDGTQEFGVGKEPPTVNVKHGKVVFEYTGDKCNATHNYTAHFEMKCDFSMGREAAVDIDVIRESHPCHFDMVLESQAACTSRIETECTAADQTGVYNLSPLTDYSNNYEIHVNENLTLILNICHSLLFGDHYSVCSDAAICMIDKSDKSNIKYKSLGKLEQHSVIHAIGGYLQIEYDSGSFCDENRPDAPPTIRSMILFVCDKNAIDTLPEYIEGLEVCHYKFFWRTVAACNEVELRDYSLINNRSCAVRDPITNYVYDLSILKQKDIKTTVNNAEYSISLCSPLKNNYCKPGSGVCRIQNSKSYGVSGGLANTNLMWKKSGPYLNYTNGRSCADGRHKYTLISFFCDRQSSFEIQEYPCSTVINMTTDVVCGRTCAHNDVSFEHLTRTSTNYIVKGNDTEYHINVCQPLVQNHSLSCPPGAGICMATGEKDGNLTVGINLGYPNPMPRVFDDGTAFLTYENGSVCKEDNDTNISSEIMFICNYGIHMGAPVFTYYKDCVYHFEWRTKYSCGKVHSTLNNDHCTVSNEYGDFWNLSLLHQKSAHNVNVFKIKSNVDDQKVYKISVCGERDFCDGSFICDDELNYGRIANVQRDYAKNVIQFKFNNGSRCSNGFYARSTINIKCNESIEVGEPILIEEQYCSLEFDWFTNASCSREKYQTPTTKRPDISPNNLSLPNRETNGVTVGQIVSVLLAITVVTSASYWYFRNNQRRVHFLIGVRNFIDHGVAFFRRDRPMNDLVL